MCVWVRAGYILAAIPQKTAPTLADEDFNHLQSKLPKMSGVNVAQGAKANESKFNRKTGRRAGRRLEMSKSMEGNGTDMDQVDPFMRRDSIAQTPPKKRRDEEDDAVVDMHKYLHRRRRSQVKRKCRRLSRTMIWMTAIF